MHLFQLSLHHLLCPPIISTPWKKAFSEQKCRADTVTQFHVGSHYLFQLTIYIVLFWWFRHELGNQSAHSFQDSFLKSRSRLPPTLEDLSKEWLFRNLGILFQKLFCCINLCLYMLGRLLTQNKWTLFYSCFLHYQFSWFNIVTMPKCTSGRYASKCPFFLIYFFLGFASLPMSGCWQHHLLAFHSPSWLVPLLQKCEDLQTNYQNSFCMFNVNSIIFL